MDKQMCLLQDTEELLKCKICQERITPPMVMCCKGHCVCKKCIKTRTVCPICDKSLLPNRFVMLEKVLNILPRRCKYFKDGCNKVIPGNSEHDKYCLDRPMKCELGRDTLCTWTGSFRDWLEHARDASHADVTFWNGTSNLAFVQYYGFEPTWTFYNMLVQFESCYFWLHSMKCYKKHLHVTSEYLGQHSSTSSPIPNYRLEITFLKDSVTHLTVQVNAENSVTSMCEVPLNKLAPLVNAYKELDMIVELQIQNK